ncbi:MAG: hypothetical protein ACT4PU_06710 [Planctomycetota bacterium]
MLLPRPEAALARRLFAVSPLVQHDRDVVFLDDRGLERLHGGPPGLFAAVRRALLPEAPLGLALASNRFTAEVAARCLRRPVVVREGEEALFLSRLPLGALPLPPALARRLLPLGLETLGDFASLPAASVERRFGQAGVALHRLARGLDGRGLLPDREPRSLRSERALDEPVDSLQRLLPALEEALTSLCAWLTEDGLGATGFALQLTLDSALPEEAAGAEVQLVTPRAHCVEVTLSAPEERAPLLLDLLRLKLEAQPPAAAVVALAVQVTGAARLAVHQNALFGEVARDAARRAEALARLATLFGPQAVASPALRRAHRLEERWAQAESGASASATPRASPAWPALRVLPAPEELVAVHEGGRLAAFARGGRQLRIARVHGPRRLTGGWWREPWARDEYELVTPEGRLYRVARDLHAGRWLLLAEED